MEKHDIKVRFQQKAGNSNYKLYVYDDVKAKGSFDWDTWEYQDSETSAKFFKESLDAIPDGEIIELHVNSNGGDMQEGTAIYNLLRAKSEAGNIIVGYVDGAAYSIAMTIMMGCDEIHMGLGTSMFLHNPWMIAMGNANQLRNQADQLDRLAESSRQLYLQRANSKEEKLTEAELTAMMDKETMLSPEDCLKYGFCDVIDGLEDDKDAQIDQLKQQLLSQEMHFTKQLEELKAKMKAEKGPEPPKKSIKELFSRM